MLHEHRQFYNLERPNHAITCNNRPPSLALKQVPYLPRLPQTLDPDAWLQHYHHHTFKRRVRQNGTLSVDNDQYYVGKRYAGQPVLLRVDALAKQFEIWYQNRSVKVCPIRNLLGGELSLEAYVEYIVKEAQSEERRLRTKRKRRQLVA